MGGVWVSSRDLGGLVEFFQPAQLRRVMALACPASLGHIDPHGDVAEWLKAAVC
jgi:hypothetical protein